MTRRPSDGAREAAAPPLMGAAPCCATAAHADGEPAQEAIGSSNNGAGSQWHGLGLRTDPTTRARNARLLNASDGGVDRFISSGTMTVEARAWFSWLP